MKEYVRRILTCTLLATLWIAVPARAFAEGPGTGGRRVRINDERIGPYLLRVVTSPTPPRVGSLYVEVRVSDPATDRAITDADISVRAEHLDGDAPQLAVAATHDIAPIPTEYAAHLPVSEAGDWEITVFIQGPLGEAQATFVERVTTPTSIGAYLSLGLPVLGLVIVAVIFLRLHRQFKQTAESE